MCGLHYSSIGQCWREKSLKKQTLKTHYFWFCPSPYANSYAMLRKLNSKKLISFTKWR